ncbi:hypothetical protein GALL_472120 [mine drainage metagenome]|uniref:Uncharacterized protein n=1 Tax=mine drainage metagenome TaxID=410659 RepID=A0A1J5Q5G8_9ZZZZ
MLDRRLFLSAGASAAALALAPGARAAAAKSGEAAKLDRLTETLEEVLDRAAADRRPTHEVADEMAQARIAAAKAERLAA